MRSPLSDRTIVAFYHDPPLWVGTNPVDRANGMRLDLELLNQEVFRRKLSCGIELRVSIEGIFAFDFTDWTPGRRPSQDLIDADFDELANAAVNRTYAMNAFLSFLYTRRAVHDKFSHGRMVVTPELEITTDNIDMEGAQGFGNNRVSHLALSRFISTYSMTSPPAFDSRILSRNVPISETAVTHAAEDFSTVVSRGGLQDVLLLDLFLRASKAFQDHNYSLSIINYWAVIEKLIGILWKNMQDDYRHRDGVVFIDGARRRRLDDGRTFTAAVVIEMLSFNNYIDNQTYDDLTRIRKVRNEWMHNLRPASADSAKLAGEICAGLLKKAKDYVVISTAARSIHG